MFCPVCKDEFRPGFTRCASCDVELVESLEEAQRAAAPAPAPRPSGMPTAMREYCGFFSLDDARGYRDRLREHGIRSDILIREAPDAPEAQASGEEYWLRVDMAAWNQAVALLEADVEPETDDEPAPFTCDRCGHGVTEEDDRCPNCGARFDG